MNSGIIDASFESEAEFALDSRSYLAYVFNYGSRPLVFIGCTPFSSTRSVQRVIRLATVWAPLLSNLHWTNLTQWAVAFASPFKRGVR